MRGFARVGAPTAAVASFVVGEVTRYVAFRSQKGLPLRIVFPGSRAAATLPQRGAVSGPVCAHTFASSAVPEITAVFLDQGSGFKETVFVDNDDLDKLLRNKGAGGLEEVSEEEGTKKVVNNIKLLKRGGKYKIEGLKEKPKPKQILLDELDGRGPAKVMFTTDEEFLTYLQKAKVQRLEATGDDGQEFALKLEDLQQGKLYRFPAFKAKSQPVTVKIDVNDGTGPVPQTFINRNEFLSYLSRAGVSALEVVGAEVVERTSEFSELDPSKTYRWPADPESSEDLRRQINNQNRAFQQPVQQMFERYVAEECGVDLLPTEVEYKLVDEAATKRGRGTRDVDLLLRSKDGMQHFLVEAKRWAREDVINQQINTILAYEELEDLPAGATVQGVVAAQGWGAGVMTSAWKEGWWVVVDAGGNLDVLESPPA